MSYTFFVPLDVPADDEESSGMLSSASESPPRSESKAWSSEIESMNSKTSEGAARPSSSILIFVFESISCYPDKKQYFRVFVRHNQIASKS
jgi:hypothetical protein